MPKALSGSERANIKDQLTEQALACLSRFGLRKTTVDELVKRVGIPKGTFYLLYPSKEMLFFEAFLKKHDELQDLAIKGIEELKDNINVDNVTQHIFRVYKQVQSTELYQFITGGDFETVLRRIPPDALERHEQRDLFSMERLFAMLPIRHSDEEHKAFATAIRAAFCSMLHKKEIGEEYFDEAVLIMLRGILSQLFDGGKK
jgi:AcrR family transcriptional regulator